MKGARAAEPLHSLAAIRAWLAEERQAQVQTVTHIPLSKLEQWRLLGDPLHLAHSSGRFFTIEGVHVRTDAGPIPA